MHSFLCGLPVNNWAVWNGSGGSALYRIHFFTCFTIYCFWFNFCCGNSPKVCFLSHCPFIDWLYWKIFAMLFSDWYSHNGAWDVRFSVYMANMLRVLVFYRFHFNTYTQINVISNTINNIVNRTQWLTNMWSSYNCMNK